MMPRRRLDQSPSGVSTEECHVAMWKMKKQLKELENCKGNGTSMISLILPPKTQISKASKMLAYEMGTASNIKSKVNRLSVQNAIRSVRERLKLFDTVPQNGLAIFCGNVTTNEGKQKFVNKDIVPFKPINTSIYLCDNKFHLDALNALLKHDDRVGFIVINGNGTLFGYLEGTERKILHKMAVDLPNKHNKGGQSSLRFSRQRSEKRQAYLVKVCEKMKQLFITNDRPNVKGLVLAGCADLKNDLRNCQNLDARLSNKVIKIVDVGYGGENGFNQAIELAAESLQHIKYVQDKMIIEKFFEEIAKDTGKYCFGVDNTFQALEIGAASRLLCSESLDIQRYVLKNNTTKKKIIRYLAPIKQKDKSQFIDKETGVELELVICEPLLDWLVKKYEKFGTILQIVSENSEEGSQFAKGFGGIGCLLRHEVNFQSMQLGDEALDISYEY